LRGIGRNHYKKRFPHRFLPSLGAIRKSARRVPEEATLPIFLVELQVVEIKDS
jgi:hypothetical protein